MWRRRRGEKALLLNGQPHPPGTNSQSEKPLLSLHVYMHARSSFRQTFSETKKRDYVRHRSASSLGLPSVCNEVESPGRGLKCLSLSLSFMYATSEGTST